MRWTRSAPGLSPPQTELDKFIDALAAEVERLAAEVERLKAKVGP